MAEGLAGYLDVVNERIEALKKTAHALQSCFIIKNIQTSKTTQEEVPRCSKIPGTNYQPKQFNEEPQPPPTFTNLLVKQTKLKN